MVPILTIIVIHQVLMYLIAIQFDQTNYNFYNICGNIFIIYVILMHVVVLMPLFFLRNKCYIKGDYLWSPTCTFVIPFSKTLDINGLNKAIKEYNKEYLQKLVDGEDPNETRDLFLGGDDDHDDEIFWKKSKLGDFSRTFANAHQDSNNMNTNDNKEKGLNAKTVKYRTFDEHNDLESNEFDDLMDIDYETNRNILIESNRRFRQS